MKCRSRRRYANIFARNYSSGIGLKSGASFSSRRHCAAVISPLAGCTRSAQLLIRDPTLTSTASEEMLRATAHIREEELKPKRRANSVDSLSPKSRFANAINTIPDDARRPLRHDHRRSRPRRFAQLERRRRFLLELAHGRRGERTHRSFRSPARIKIRKRSPKCCDF